MAWKTMNKQQQYNLLTLISDSYCNKVAQLFGGFSYSEAYAGLTEHGAKRSKGLIMLGATVYMDRGLSGGVEYDVC